MDGKKQWEEFFQRNDMAAIRQLLVLIFVCASNYLFLNFCPQYFKYLFGLEFIVCGLLLILKIEWTAEFLRVNLLSYPGLRYFLGEDFIMSKVYIRFLGMGIILLGLMMMFLAPSSASSVQ